MLQVACKSRKAALTDKAVRTKKSKDMTLIELWPSVVTDGGLHSAPYVTELSRRTDDDSLAVHMVFASNGSNQEKCFRHNVQLFSDPSPRKALRSAW